MVASKHTSRWLRVCSSCSLGRGGFQRGKCIFCHSDFKKQTVIKKMLQLAENSLMQLQSVLLQATRT